MRRAVPWLRRLFHGLSQRRPLFDPRSAHVRFVVEKRALGQVSLRVLVLSPVSIISPLCASVSSTASIVYVDYLHSGTSRWTVFQIIMWSCSSRRLAVGTFRPRTLTYQTMEGRAYVCMPRRKLETAAGESWLSSDTALTPVRLTVANKCVDVAFSSCERRI
jgi:hypothetical protein